MLDISIFTRDDKPTFNWELAYTGDIKNSFSWAL